MALESPHTAGMHSLSGPARKSGLSLVASALAGLLSLLSACGPLGGVQGDGDGAANQGGTSATASGGAAPVALPDPPAFKVVGYQPSWAGTLVGLQFDKLDYIDYAFAIEQPDGSVTMPKPATLLVGLVNAAHQSGVRVLLSVGGWNNGDASAFATLSGNADARTKFATTLDGYVDQYQLDGVDIDWEFPEGGVAVGYTAMMQELSAHLRPKGKLITIAGAAFNGGSSGITADAIQYIDMVNIMAYDGDNGAGHSPFSFAQSALTLWQGKGFPMAKLILGVPFYSRPSNTPYSALVTMNAAASTEDQLTTASGGTEFYNGIPTVQAKTALAMAQGGGIMAWDLSQDSRSADASLVTAIYAKIHAAP